jgi:hypothetical protein
MKLKFFAFILISEEAKLCKILYSFVELKIVLKY